MTYMTFDNIVVLKERQLQFPKYVLEVNIKILMLNAGYT